MATKETAAVKNEKIRQAIVTRFKFQLKALQGALTDDNAKNVEIATKRLVAIKGEADAADFQLPAPSDVGFGSLDEQVAADGALSAFDGYEFAEAPAAAPATNGEVAAEDDPTMPKASKTAKERAKEAKAAKGAAGVKAPRVKKERVQKECLDGCGTLVYGKFAPGHDAKLKSLILKAERGEAAVSDIIGDAADLVKFRKGPAPSKGEKQTFICTQSPVKIPGRDDVKFV